MKMKTTIIILIAALCCVGIAFAEENSSNTTDSVDDSQDVSVEESEISEDGAIYILITSISGDEIKFNDGFTGYCLDSGKDKITQSDKFTLGSLKNDEKENYVKLAIIECYKQKKENDIGKVIAKIAAGDLDANDDVIKEILNSNEKVNDHTTVKIDNTTEATFDFELLTSADGDKSDCLAYTVSMKTVESEDTSQDDVLGVSEDSSKNLTEDNEDKVKADDAANGTDDDKKTDDSDNASKNDTKEDSSKDAKNNSTKDETIVNETNKTIVNKTNTKITVENNTTITYKNNVKTVNKTAPANNTTNDLLKTAGNPIFILGVVIVVALIAVAFMKRKD